MPMSVSEAFSRFHRAHVRTSRGSNFSRGPRDHNLYETRDEEPDPAFAEGKRQAQTNKKRSAGYWSVQIRRRLAKPTVVFHESRPQQQACDVFGVKALAKPRLLERTLTGVGRV